MLLLKTDEVQRLLGDVDMTAALRKALLEEARGQAHVPPRITADAQGDRGWLRMGPAFLNGAGYMGFKAMNRRPGLGMRYQVMVYDMDTGAPVALMDANELTTARTAAVNALGTHLLAPAATSTVGIVGSGVQASALLAALLELRDIDTILVYSPRETSRVGFAREVAERHGIVAEPRDSVEAVVADSDAVLLALRAPAEPVFQASLLRPGLHVTGLSSVRPDVREVDDATWTASDVVVVDSRGSVFQSGDGRSIVAAGKAPDDFPTLAQLVAGEVAGRTSDEQITLFKSSGDSLQDLAAGVAVYEAARELGVGIDLGDDYPEVKPYD